MATADCRAPDGHERGPARQAAVPLLLFRQHDLARRVLLLEPLHLAILHYKLEGHVGKTGSPEGCTLDLAQRNDWLTGQQKRQATVRRERDLNLDPARSFVRTRKL